MNIWISIRNLANVNVLCSKWRTKYRTLYMCQKQNNIRYMVKLLQSSKWEPVVKWAKNQSYGVFGCLKRSGRVKQLTWHADYHSWYCLQRVYRPVWHWLHYVSHSAIQKSFASLENALLNSHHPDRFEWQFKLSKWVSFMFNQVHTHTLYVEI